MSRLQDEQQVVNNAIDTVYTKSELLQLYYEKAVAYRSEHCMKQIDRVFRCKPQSYWNDIMTSHNGIMEVYVKDNSGHPRSPINGRLKGKFIATLRRDRAEYGPGLAFDLPGLAGPGQALGRRGRAVVGG